MVIYCFIQSLNKYLLPVTILDKEIIAKKKIHTEMKCDKTGTEKLSMVLFTGSF